MTKIRVKYHGEYVMCDVSDKNCKSKRCLSPHKYIHNNRNIDGCPNGKMKGDYNDNRKI